MSQLQRQLLGQSGKSGVHQIGFRPADEAGRDLFILAFLGLAFLAATGSMIYFKQLT